MGCLQREFGGALFFRTFRHSSKLRQIRDDDRVLVAYVKPEKYEYVAISGRAKVVEDKEILNELWGEGLRVWFPKGPDDPELAVLAIEVEKADYWANPASLITHAFAYMKARLTGKSLSPDEIAETKSVRFRDREGG
ncbi:pyridoxamine 5'-phosphate oxidase family protein [Bradyrhizobium diazoefficiens]|nr:pyridoxamine 5'-phosphate oxidase family protein [Bradyrhizobium diazoefficiens]MBR0965543.1 pyridoxamine 5'-phosphate oxidase family protein [Bradyrhizobium diazoefficiens]MBR0979234.1 pyridoxamine 5'-phosphate oxidase family protein [Bradyrhizobium diazoefficiens]MBR1008626.1 pyridoxamine 5'-phosphate oxidase family protein [Bradyrhizobium diazoefficiens]MBR1014625.1 pyridoxamine 5'-phosphate oxidase family protein [Bradyrhizobium diazoefficiens]MBR1052587.1 pyridoxamine 5'-phosphate oxid